MAVRASGTTAAACVPAPADAGDGGAAYNGGAGGWSAVAADVAKGAELSDDVREKALRALAVDVQHDANAVSTWRHVAARSAILAAAGMIRGSDLRANGLTQHASLSIWFCCTV